MRSKYFASEEAAEAHLSARAGEVVGFGEGAVSMEERFLLSRLREVANNEGVSLSALVAPLFDRPTRERPALEDALAAFDLHNRDVGVAPEMRKSYRYIVGALVRGRERIRVDALTPDLIRAHLLSRYSSEVTRRSNRGRIVRFLNFCAAPSEHQKPWDTRPWLEPGMGAKIDWKARKVESLRPEILHLPAILRLLGRAPAVMRPALALQTFAGIRPRELTRDCVVKETTPERAARENRGEPAPWRVRLCWEDVDFERRSILIRAAVSKTNEEWRLLDLPKNLWPWLEAGRQESGPIWPHRLKSWMVQHKALRQAASVPHWPRDALRHTFASHGYWRGLEWALDTMRHTRQAAVFTKHYKGNVTASEGRAFFGIYPEFCLWPKALET